LTKVLNRDSLLRLPYRETAQTEARRNATRGRIAAAARELIAHGGYGEAQVAAVAGRAGVATGTVYRHFPSKADLFAEVFREASQHEVDALAASAAAARGGAAAKLGAAVETFARRALRARRLAWALLAEPVDPAIEAERLAFRRAYRDVLAAVIDEGIAAGELPGQDVEVAAAALVGAIGEAMVGPLAPTAAAHDPAALVASLRDFCLRSVTGDSGEGLSAPKAAGKGAAGARKRLEPSSVNA
jgi:AcrR family transcriptional regulator